MRQDKKKEDNDKTLPSFSTYFSFNYSDTTLKGISTATSLCNLTVAL